MTQTPSNKEPSAQWMVGTLMLAYIVALFLCGFVLSLMNVRQGLVVAFLFGMYLNHLALSIRTLYLKHKKPK